MTFTRAFGSPRRLIATRRQLLAHGFSPLQLTAAVRSGDLIRVRRGHYAQPGTDDLVLQAVRIGGRLTCVSALQRFGVWVADDPFPHVALRHEASRLRSPRNRFVPLSDRNRDGAALHWWPVAHRGRASEYSVSAIDALVHVVRCQPHDLAIASLDSALYERVIRRRDLDHVFGALPEKYQSMRAEIDARCMSGIESILRLLLTELGLPFELQRRFDGVGTVDFVLADCMVIETDGALGHKDDESQLRDYDRDAALAARGYTVLRFNYRQVMFHRTDVVAAIRGALASHRRYLG